MGHTKRPKEQREREAKANRAALERFAADPTIEVWFQNKTSGTYFRVRDVYEVTTPKGTSQMLAVTNISTLKETGERYLLRTSQSYEACVKKGEQILIKELPADERAVWNELNNIKPEHQPELPLSEADDRVLNVLTRLQNQISRLETGIGNLATGQEDVGAIAEDVTNIAKCMYHVLERLTELEAKTGIRSRDAVPQGAKKMILRAVSQQG